MTLLVRPRWIVGGAALGLLAGCDAPPSGGPAPSATGSASAAKLGAPSGSAGAAPSPSAFVPDRTVLPVHLPARPTFSEVDVRKATQPARHQVQAPEGAPNVVVVLLDDVGFSAPSTFGGAVDTPRLDALAKEGLRLNNFHTTSLCSPTRMALKTGRNHHMAEAGSVMESATGFPGNTGQVTSDVAPLAEMLRLNGYATAAFGKWHETATWEGSPVGPFARWPLHQGFDHFYGFLGGETNQWAPTLYDGHTRVEPPQTPGYHFMTDMTDRAITWLTVHESLAPKQPFFVYFAPGSTHAPHHVPREWVEKFAGRFDGGWDALREETLARQKRLGLVPESTKLAKKPEAIKDWASLSDVERKVFARQAEVYAGFLAHADHETGRFLDALDTLGEKDDTLVIYIAGDNGASAEGGPIGLFNEMSYFNGVAEKLEDLAERLAEWGDATTYPHMAAGWAVAFDTPHAWTKQVASDFGGTRNGAVVRWPAKIKSVGEVRQQFHHVTDVAPTILAAASLPEPVEVNGVRQVPMQGVSMLPTFDAAAAPERHTTQYFEMFGNRAIYHDGWYARTVHRAAWERSPRRPLADDVWELYDTRSDFALADDLAAKEPARLAELQQVFLREAERNHVLPIDDRMFERLSPAKAGRPDLMAGRRELTLVPGMSLTENTFLQLKNTSFVLTAKVHVADAKVHGVLLVQGGRFGGWALHVEDGFPAFTYTYLGLETVTVRGTTRLPKGDVTVRASFAYDGGDPGSGGTVEFTVDGAAAGSGRLERTQPGFFSADETVDVGWDSGTAVIPKLGAGEASRLTGARIESILVELPPAP